MLHLQVGQYLPINGTEKKAYLLTIDGVEDVELKLGAWFQSAEASSVDVPNRKVAIAVDYGVKSNLLIQLFPDLTLSYVV